MKKVLLVFNSNHAQHDGRMNECAARVEAVLEELKNTGAWESCSRLDAALEVSFREKAEASISAIHTAGHLERLRNEFRSANQWNCTQCTFSNDKAVDSCGVCGAARQHQGQFIIPSDKNDVYLCENSLQVALENCAGCIAAARQVLDGKVDSAFALVRPPGHHASSESFGSYCLLNGVAVTAHALAGRRLLIVDWDVHHGDGTQAIMESSPDLSQRCRFVSIHRHDEGFWPKSGKVEESGKAVLNIPLQGTSYGDADYYYIVEKVIVPWGQAFSPDLILVSAGYDCAKGDPLGRFEVTSEGFGRMTRMLRGVAPCLFVLEGGYDVEDHQQGEIPHRPLRQGVAATIQSLLNSSAGEPVPALPSTWRDAVRPETKEVVAKVLIESEGHKGNDSIRKR
jgi:acetoin utilization deacetylase AcuC-like enzyme